MQLFLSKTGSDMGNIDRELEKLICYTMDKSVIEAADVEAINRIMMTGGDAETAEELRRRYPRLDLTTWSKENRLQF